jgi:hypothetical protein
MHGTSISPARIANGSWNTKYRPYPFSCKFFDEALHGTYQGDVYIASAGNDGLDALSLKSTYRTIGNPAACKNTLAGKSCACSMCFIMYCMSLGVSNFFTYIEILCLIFINSWR